MYKTLITLVIWLIGIIGCLVMKRIEPDNHWYQVYAIIVAVLFTAYAILSE